MLWGLRPGAGSPLVLAAGWAVGWCLRPQTPSNSHPQCPEQGHAWCWWAVVVEKREGRVCRVFWPLPGLNSGAGKDVLHPQGSLCPPAPELLGRAAPKPPALTGDVLGKI